MIKIGINGFGRIGRLVLRALLENYKDKIQVVAINDLGSIEANAHLVKYDSTHGTLPYDVETSKSGFKILNQDIKVFAERDPENLPWGKVGVDVVLECTGLFLDKISAEKHIKAGAKKVIISAPAKEVDFTVVQGVNSSELKKDHNVISNGSCTTNCLAPIAKVLNDNFGIKSGLMTTIHAYTNDQALAETTHKDFRRGRSATQNIIPTSTGAAKAVGMVLPELNGKLDGVSMRVPTQNVSVVDFKFNAGKSTSVEEINNLIKKASNNELKNILGYTDEPLVSSDFNHDSRSSIFHMDQTKVMDGSFVRVLSWYDNEWGFSNRMSDTAVAMSKTI